MFIQTEDTPNPNTLKFVPGRTVLDAGMIEFRDAASAARSPLAKRLFDVGHVERVYLAGDYLTVTKTAATEWLPLRPLVLAAIMDHFLSGEPVLIEGGDPGDEGVEADDEKAALVRDLIEKRIRPALADKGGEISFLGIENGVVLLKMGGSPGAVLPMRTGIENMLRHYVEGFEGLRFVSDQPTAEDNAAAGKPGLESTEAQAIQRLLDEQVNPAVASHGGYITLIDVKDDKAYIQLGGGCQGCGMADVTLKQGVEVAIKEAVPSIVEVIDSTDHGGGENPYFQQSKK